LRILVACEFSGVVRDAFIARGHDARSCDLLPSETPGPHYQGDVRDLLRGGLWRCWDMIIAHPPCTHLALSGNRWHHASSERLHAAQFAMLFARLPVPRVVTENPASALASIWRPADQHLQPYMFGPPETKAVWLWLKGVQPLVPTRLVSQRDPRVHHEPERADRWRRRSRTYSGIATAMAEQWG
jgi:hypothetical protein